MKKIILSFISAVALTFTAQADVITVSNNVYSPGQYTNLQEAVDASQPYDTILVAGSTTSYGNVTIKWPLTLFGAGYNNPYGENTIVNGISLVRQNASIGANDVKISGFITTYMINLKPGFNGGTITTQKLNNIVIERCYISYGVSLSQGNLAYSSIYIRNNIIKSSVLDLGNEASKNNIKVENNVIDAVQIRDLFQGGNNGGYPNTSGVEIRNNVIINNSSNVFYSYDGNNLDGFVVSNNIFYGVWAEGCRNCSFNNNITYLCNNDDLLSGTNPGSVGNDNIIGQDPKFVNYPVLGGAFDYAHNYHLKPSSPAIGTATNGGDMGIYGGTMPFEQLGKNPNIPQMMWVDFPGNSSVPVGGTLNVDFKSHKQD